jgi:hypothetical protein
MFRKQGLNIGSVSDCRFLFATESKQINCKEIIPNGWTALPYKASSKFKGAGNPCVFDLPCMNYLVDFI